MTVIIDPEYLAELQLLSGETVRGPSPYAAIIERRPLDGRTIRGPSDYQKIIEQSVPEEQRPTVEVAVVWDTD